MKYIVILITLLALIPSVYAIDFCDDEAIVGIGCELGDFFYNNTYYPYTIECCAIDIWYPNGTLAIDNQTANNSATGFMNFTYKPVAAGYHPAQLKCDCTTADEGSTRQTESRSFTADSDTNPPKYYSLSPSSDFSQEWDGANVVYTLVSNWMDVETAISSVQFEFDGSNSSVSNITGDSYTSTVTGLLPGNYDFRWHGVDSDGNTNSTPLLTMSLTGELSEGSSVDLILPEGVYLPEEDVGILVNITPTSFTTTSQAQVLSINFLNRGDPVDLRIQADEYLDEVILFNSSGENLTSYVDFSLVEEQNLDVQFLFIPNERSGYQGELVIINQETNKALGAIPFIATESSAMPYQSVTFNVFSGNIVGALGSMFESLMSPAIMFANGPLPKFALFLIVLFILFGINHFMLPERKRLSNKKLLLLSVIPLLAIILFVPSVFA